VNIFKFVIWAWAITVLGAISNLIISFPLSLRAEKYGPREDNPERAISIPSVFARPGPLTVGLCYGALVAVLLSLSTLRWYSDHWLPQSLLAIAFVANSANQTHVHARAWMIARVVPTLLRSLVNRLALVDFVLRQVGSPGVRSKGIR
jgi:hypothetical protein